MATITKNTIKTSLGFRQSIVEKTSKLSTFGDGMWGMEIFMENGDSFGMYSKNRHMVEAFTPGLMVTYEYIKVIDYPGTEQESVKHRIDNYTFDLPRKKRFESELVSRIADAMFKAVELAGNDSGWETRADNIFGWLKNKILAETFDYSETDSYNPVLEEPKPNKNGRKG